MRALVLMLLAGATQVAGQGPSAAASLILSGGRVWTGDPALPEAEAVAIAGDRIVAVGSSDEIRPWRSQDTRVVALEGRRVVPGFIDAHVHFLGGGDELVGADLRHAPTEEAFARGLADVAAKLPKGTWITSGTWDHERWPGAPLPTRETLDRFVPDHPVFVQRLDGHMGVANSAAIGIAGVDAATKDPKGGTIVRDAQGRPAGVFKDAAMDLVSKHVPPWSEQDRLRRAQAAMRHAASLGVTGVHDMGTTSGALRTYQGLRQRGELTVRITVYAPIRSHGHWRSLGVQRGLGDHWVKFNGLKAFVDGSLGSSTALFFEPYADEPGTSGLAVTNPRRNGPLERQLRACAADGLQLAVHAIGDRANRELLDIYGRTKKLVPAEPRFRIEHAQHLTPQDIPRFTGIGVVASMQPYHAIDDGRWCEKRIGAERSKTTYAFRSLLDAGASLAFGSDWPVAPLSPILGIHAAVTRRTLDGKHPDGWVPCQKITVEEALRAYTRGSAYAALDEASTGALTPGRLADLVVLDRDLLTIGPPEIKGVQVDLTIVAGRVVFAR